MQNKVIMHVDMDAFFAACEEQNDISLSGKPIVIGANPNEGKGRGVVSTCNYEARKYGIKSAIPISRAYKLCKDAVFLPVNFRLYSKYSKTIMNILRNYSENFQQISVDEAFLDVSSEISDFDEAKIFANDLKEKVFEATGLSCSIGIGPNKLVAKVASDLNKPEGLVLVKENEAKEFLAPLDIRKLYGIGPKMEQKLKMLGINTAGELANYNKEKLMNLFGVYGIYLSESANGIGSSFVGEGNYGQISIGRETTFNYDTRNFSFVNKIIEELSCEIHEELLEEKYAFRTVNIKMRLHNFRTFTRAKTVSLSNDLYTISKTAKQLSKEFDSKKLRLVGVRVSNLENFKGQMSLKDFS